MKKQKSKQLIRIITIIGVIIIPLMYSYFYLGAFWDPYSSLDTVPVAIVNLDKGATVNGKERNLGNEMCDELKADGTLKFVFTDEDEAQKGTEGNTYYAMLTIPENFSNTISSASTADKQISQINYSANEKRNYLASQILSRAVLQIEDSLKSKVSGEIVAELCDKLGSSPDKLSELTDGLSKLSNGSLELKNGTAALSGGATQVSQGLGELNGKLNDYSNGVTSAGTGADALLTGASSLEQGIDKLAEGASTLDEATANIDELRTSAKLLADSTKTFNDGIIRYTDGVTSLIGTVQSTSSFISSYVGAHPQIMQDPTFAAFIASMSDPEKASSIEVLSAYTEQLKSASAQISSGTAMLADATSDIPTLKAGITELKNGLTAAEAGAQQLSAGTKALDAGLSELSSATSKIKDATAALASGSNEVASGANKVSDGAAQLSEGINTAESGVSTTIKDTQDQLSALNGLSEYAENPVVINESAIDSVPNYGTAFAPYFLCLSLWVGALIIFFGIYLDADNKFELLSRNAKNKPLRCFAYLLIGIAQAIILGVVLKFCLGLEIKHMALYCFAICLSSVVYISIVQFFVVFLKDIGKFLSIAMLILQLTSCGGTFPMETVPSLFNVLYPFMPMTYSVGLMKEAISAGTTTYALSNTLVLVGILLVFTVLTLVCGQIKNNTEKKTMILAEQR